MWSVSRQYKGAASGFGTNEVKTLFTISDSETTANRWFVALVGGKASCDETAVRDAVFAREIEFFAAEVGSVVAQLCDVAKGTLSGLRNERRKGPW